VSTEGIQGELVVSGDGKVYEVSSNSLQGNEVSSERLQALAEWARSHNAGGSEVSGYSYVVQPGDSLWRISQNYYGDGRMWVLLYMANADQIMNPNLIYPGQGLRVP